MDSDPLRRLLTEADADTGGAALPDDLPARVRRLARRRQSAGRAAVAIAVLVAVAAAVVATSVGPRHDAAPAPEGPTVAAVSPEEEARVAAEVARLNHEVEWRLAVATRIAALQEQRDRSTRSRAALLAAAGATDPVARIQRETDKTAYMMLMAAEQQAERNQPERAAKGYGKVVELFPDSPWAVVARERLSLIPSG